MRNPEIRLEGVELLSDKKYVYKQVEFSQRLEGGRESQKREVLDRGDSATILLFNKQKKTVILTQQVRIPTFLNGNESGLLIEACAGSIEAGESPIENIVRETEEETGYRITSPQKLFEAYVSPATMTELMHFFIAEYAPEQKVSAGGGLAEEHEHIQVLEVPFSDALLMVQRGEIRDLKTILLLQYLELKALL